MQRSQNIISKLRWDGSMTNSCYYKNLITIAI